MIHISVAQHTETGGRERNEDSILTFQTDTSGFFALADGLGGHGLGDVASQIACETSINLLKSYSTLSNQMFQEIFDSCQANILAEQAARNVSGQMRTTLNLLCFQDNTAYWSHVGDSRTYFFKDNKIAKRTFDHSVPQMLAAIGEIKDSDIRFHEDRNRLLRVIGAADKPPIFENEDPISLTGNERFLMCSDGFWELITEEQMELCLMDADDPEFWLKNMTELVHINGAGKRTDNTSAIAIWID